ncbi:3-deoxy-D-manno-octulosonic acid kinase [Halomonas cibimaris]|uniref:3-deoxy-D-manno-octulosonic acid kinase n=1 Tax=Halomonas cibimaris TaxID=657012 RepID=A0ABP7LRN3_9GAMM
MRLAALRQKKSLILHDADILCEAQGLRQKSRADRPAPFTPDDFSPEVWRRRGCVTGEAPGRGSSLFIRPVADAAEQWVLRPYRRGGMAARVSEARYLWTGAERTRAFREMRLTARLYTQGLPVPRPVAACVTRHGLAYEAALITRRLPGATALASLLDTSAIAPERLARVLTRVGAMIRRFHNAGLDHVDLNARNILVDADDTPWLIDLDRCRLRAPGKWRQGNLSRLERSLGKFAAPDAATRAIQHINAGYEG